jgi:two-component system, LuxR family, response regulator FixJ
LSSTRKPGVIIVDDDPSVRRALRMQLSIAGFRVRAFDSAENFLAAKIASTDTCLLLDIYMRGMRGIELLKHLAAAGRKMPTVLMSGRDDEETNALARRVRGTPCLFKPFDQSALLRAITKAMHRKSMPDF